MTVLACPHCARVLHAADEGADCPGCGQPLSTVSDTRKHFASSSSTVVDIQQPHETVIPQNSDGNFVITRGSQLTGRKAAAASTSSSKEEGKQRHVKSFRVVDGADQGRFFVLNENSVTTIGSSGKHADICLHDLYVARVHCQIKMEGGRLFVTSSEASRPTFVNGRQIQQEELLPGDVVRVGNSHLQLEFFEASESAPLAPILAAGPTKPPRLLFDRLAELAGETLGHFKLGPVLGRGYFGVVFRATDLRSNRVVALKVLSPEFPASDGEMQQFIEAMKVALPIRHSSLVTLNGVGKSGHYCWISREFVEGGSLAWIIHESVKATKDIDWRLALRVAVHVGQALEACHELRLVHNSVTPQNILIQNSDEQIKLADLMFYKAIDGSLHWQTTLEKRTSIELNYLAPEQTMPGAFVDDLTDLYSLGVVLYNMLTGLLPFRGKTNEETLRLVRETVPAKPKKFQRTIPSLFQEVVLKMLAKRQEDRYATPSELLVDLKRLAKERNVKV